MIYLSYLEFNQRAKKCRVCGSLSERDSKPNICLDAMPCGNFVPLYSESISSEVFRANSKAAVDFALLAGELSVVDNDGKVIIRFSRQTTEI